MSTELTEMPFLRNIGFVMTYRCQIACPHCIIEASPSRIEEVSLRNAFDWVQQIVEFRQGYIKFLSLTGGEPFYNVINLKKIADFGESQGLIVSAVTNAFWASTIKEAVQILKGLSSIKLLAISADVYHQKLIPFERVKNAIMAAKECGINYHVHVCTENVEDKGYRDIVGKLEEIIEKDTMLTAITFPVGRSLGKVGMSKYRMSEDIPISACSSANSPIIFLDGRVMACIGPVIDLRSPHPLILGNLRNNSLSEILENAESNSILHAIRVWGPKKLISLIKKAGLDQHLPKEYIKDIICNACYSLMSDGKIVEFLTQLAEDAEFKQEVAYARAYYLNETIMSDVYQSTQMA